MVEMKLMDVTPPIQVWRRGMCYPTNAHFANIGALEPLRHGSLSFCVALASI